MSDPIADIEGIGPTYAEKLASAGIDNTGDLLERCGASSGRDAVAEETGIDGSRLLSWVNMADLMRIKGVGGEYAELMHAAGVDTIKELRRRNAANLSAKMAEVNEEKSLTRRVPSESTVSGWIEEAGELEPAVSH